MEQNKIIESNKLIAEFMGDFKLIKEFKPEPDVDITYMWKKTSNKSFGYDTTDWRDYSTDTEYSDRVCYNFSWDWLMPVVEKIESLGYDFSIDNCYVRIWDGGQSNFEMTFSEPTKLLTAYFAVIEFIKWYNNERK